MLYRAQGLNPLRAAIMVTGARKNSLLIRKKGIYHKGTYILPTLPPTVHADVLAFAKPRWQEGNNVFALDEYLDIGHLYSLLIGTPFGMASLAKSIFPVKLLLQGEEETSGREAYFCTCTHSSAILHVFTENTTVGARHRIFSINSAINI